MQGATTMQYQLPGQEVAMSEWAEDAESCCGETPLQSSSCPSLQCAWGVAHDQGLQPQLVSYQQEAQLASQQCSDAMTKESEVTRTCNDFDALDGSVLLDEADSFDAYPGGVEAALADWQAAVSSRAAAPVVSVPAAAAAADATSSSSIQQQHPCQQPYVPQWQPQPCPPLTAGKQQQLQQWLQQLPTPLGVQPAVPGPTVLIAHPQQQYHHQHHHQQQQQQQQQQRAVQPAVAQQQSCPFAAFKGDVVGAVLAGLMPAPSCDSNDEWMGPLCPGLPCC